MRISHVLILGGLTVTCFGLGWWLGNGRSAIKAPLADSAPPSLLGGTSHQTASTLLTPLGKAFHDDLLSTFADENPLRQTHSILAIALAQGIDAFPVLADQCEPGSLASRTLTALWADLDPQRAAAHWLRRSGNKHSLESVIIFTRWAETDPLGALKGLQAEPTNAVAAQSSMLHQALERAQPEALQIAAGINKMAFHYGTGDEPVRIGITDRGDFEQLLEAAPRHRYRLHQPLLERFVDLHPEAALDWLSSRSSSGMKYDAELFARFYAKEPEAALTYAEKQSPETAAQFQTAAAVHLAGADPQGALAWAQEHQQGAARLRTLEAVLEEWSRKDPNAALAEMDLLPSLTNRRTLTDRIVKTWLQTDQEAALSYLRNLPPMHLPVDRRSSLYYQWRQADLDGAAAYVSELSEQDIAPGFATTVAQGFSEAGRLEDGLAWFDGLTEARKHQAASDLFESTDVNLAAQALELIRTVPNEDFRTIMHRSLLGSWLPQDPEGAVEWLRSDEGRPFLDKAKEVIQILDTSSEKREVLLRRLD